MVLPYRSTYFLLRVLVLIRWRRLTGNLFCDDKFEIDCSMLPFRVFTILNV